MKSDDLLRHLSSVKDEYIEEIMTESVRSARRSSGKRNAVASDRSKPCDSNTRNGCDGVKRR